MGTRMAKIPRRKATAAPACNRGADRILRAARRVFVEHGGAGFSARGVAKQAGMSLGAIQHFFRTKDELLAATLEHVLGEFRREYDRLQQTLPFSAEARLLGAVDMLVEDLWRQESRKFFFGFYALSTHNEFAQKLMNETFAHHQRRFATYLAAARPQLSEQRCLDLALQITSMIDGLMIYTAPGTKAISPRARLTELVRDSVMQLIGPLSSSAYQAADASREE